MKDGRYIMLKRICSFLLLVSFLLALCAHAQAADKLNIYIDKAALLSHDVGAADIRVRPEEKVRVTRHSLWPWDEEGSAFTLFVEIENTSDEKIVFDDDWLYACKTDREDIDFIFGAISAPPHVLQPGEKLVLHAGAAPWLVSNGNKGNDEILGLSTFARRIRQAKILRLRFEYRGNQSGWERLPTEIDARAWIEDGTLYFETTNASDQTAEYYSVGVIVSDRDGRIIDLLCTRNIDEAVIAPGETLTLEKALQPYITPEMTDGATFEVFAYSL